MHKEVLGDTILSKTDADVWFRDSIHWDAAQRFCCWLDLTPGRHGNAVRCLLLFCLLVVCREPWRVRRQKAF
jgi:hypothetical protein